MVEGPLSEWGSRLNLWPFYTKGIKILLLNTILGTQSVREALANAIFSYHYFILFQVTTALLEQQNMISSHVTLGPMELLRA